MKRVIVFIFLLKPFIVSAQLADDSLKTICKHLFENERKKANTTPASSPITFRTESIEELFAGGFKQSKAFLLTARAFGTENDSILYTFMHGGYYHKLYVLDNMTGKELIINTIEQYNNMFSDSVVICNLDKCYLYMILTEQPKGQITAARDYRKTLNSNSAFLHKAAGLITAYCYTYDTKCKEHISYHSFIQQKLKDDINNSVKNNIDIHVVHKPEPCSFCIDSIDRYQFIFRGGGRLYQVNKTQVELPSKQ